MSLPPIHDPLTAAVEIREQMATHERRIALFLGAGASIAAGLPGLDGLTEIVSKSVKDRHKVIFDALRKSLGASPNVEDILNHLRLLRDLLSTDSSKSYEGITGDEATKTDVAVCQAIRKAVLKQDASRMDAHFALSSWIRYVNRDQPVEIFTTNYDLNIETAFEDREVPYFDGFVGAVKPFFVPECVEADISKQSERDYPPRAWTRLWKLHGSVGWYLEKGNTGIDRIIRGSSSDLDDSAELVIYPSREKYVASRKLPFTCYADRFRKVLSVGESLLLIVGYSFRDGHINDVLRQGLRSNPRLAIHAFIFEDPGTELMELAQTYRNCSVFGPVSACLSGRPGAWLTPSRKKQTGEEWPFWDDGKNRFTLGDFSKFGDFLRVSTEGGMRPITGITSNPPQAGGTQNP